MATKQEHVMYETFQEGRYDREFINYGIHADGPFPIHPSFNKSPLQKELEIPISILCHATGLQGASGICENGFFPPDRFRRDKRQEALRVAYFHPKIDEETLTFLKFNLPDDYLLSPAFQPDISRYGSYVFHYSFDQLLEAYRSYVGGDFETFCYTKCYPWEVQYTFLFAPAGFKGVPPDANNPVYNMIRRVWKVQHPASLVKWNDDDKSTYPIRWQCLGFAFVLDSEKPFQPTPLELHCVRYQSKGVPSSSQTNYGYKEAAVEAWKESDVYEENQGGVWNGNFFEFAQQQD